MAILNIRGFPFLPEVKCLLLSSWLPYCACSQVINRKDFALSVSLTQASSAGTLSTIHLALEGAYYSLLGEGCAWSPITYVRMCVFMVMLSFLGYSRPAVCTSRHLKRSFILNMLFGCFASTMPATLHLLVTCKWRGHAEARSA